MIQTSINQTLDSLQSVLTNLALPRVDLLCPVFFSFITPSCTFQVSVHEVSKLNFVPVYCVNYRSVPYDVMLCPQNINAFTL